MDIPPTHRGQETRTMTARETMERTQLSDLVRARMDEIGLGFRTLADACIDRAHPENGPLWKHSTIENLVKGRVTRSPSEADLRALAVGLDLPFSVVQRAAGAQFLGITEHWDKGYSTRVLVAQIEELDEEEVEEVAELAQFVFRRRARKSSGQD